MTLKTKIKLWFVFIMTVLAVIAYFVLNMEFIQKKIFDVKADMVGSNRTITFYSNIDATKVASFSDKDMRFETEPNGTVSVWLGSQNKKVKSNMQYIVEDVK